MKENIIISSLAVLILALGIALVYEPNDKEIYASTNNEIVTENSLAMMYETEAGSGEYEVVDDTSWPQSGYKYNAELSRCENGSTITWDEASKKVILNANISDKCYVYFDKENPPLSDYIVNNVYTGVDGDNDLYYHDGQGTYTNANQEAGDNSYRYAGANPNNYVCFGSDAASCPNDNLYRIIGVFGNQVKLIKATSYGIYVWNEDLDNTWDESTKPDIYTTLNETYYNTIPVEWQNMIAETTWQVGGMAMDDSYIAKQYYAEEVGTGQSGYVETMKIGLMYVSDYGYGADPNKWTTAISDTLSNYGTNNWLYLGLIERLISPTTNIKFGTFYVTFDGFVLSDLVSNAFAIRPSFYLESSVVLSGGTGTSTDPYRIA